MGNFWAYVLYFLALIVNVCLYVFKDLIEIFLFGLHALLGSTLGFWIEMQRVRFVKFPIDMRSFDIGIEHLYWSELFYLFIHIWKLNV